MYPPYLEPRTTEEGRVTPIQGGWRLSISGGQSGAYRLAQLDDYGELARRNFPCRPPLRLDLRARSSHKTSPGTWGFGLWNDPFGLSLGFGGGARLPALPQAAWFFFAAPENHLSLQDRQPATGALAASIRSNPMAYALAPMGIPSLPFLLWRPTSRALRRAAARFVQQEAAQLEMDAREWGHYTIIWEEHQVSFQLNNDLILAAPLSPRPPLGLVLWIDNQYAAWRPDGSLGYGSLATSTDSWIEITDLKLSTLP